MVDSYVQDDHLYRAYALKICGCNDLKDDLVNDMYIKLHGILERDPNKQINNSFIFLMIRSIFLDGIRAQREHTVDIMPEPKYEPCEALCERVQMDEALSRMKFYDRELLLKTHEKSVRQLAKEVGINYMKIHREKVKSIEKLKDIWQEKEGRKGLATQ